MERTSSMENETNITTLNNHTDPFPIDPLFEILKRLPVKTLLSFRCVSKSLDTLTRNSSFINSQYKFHQGQNQTSLLCLSDDDSGPRPSKHQPATLINRSKNLPLTLPFSCSNYKIVGSCQGLVCVHVPKSGQLYLWNPPSQRFKLVPDAPLLDIATRTKRKSNVQVVFGLGYGPNTQDHKIVRIVYRGKNSVPDVAEVYSLKADSWKIIDRATIPGIAVSGTGMFFDGRINWVATVPGRERYVKIMWYDVEEEVFGKRYLPEACNIGCLTRGEWPRLAEVNGKLVYVTVPRLLKEFRLRVWEMDAAGRWSKRGRREGWLPKGKDNEMFSESRGVTLTGSGVFVFEMREYNLVKKFVLWDMVNGECKNVELEHVLRGQGFHFVSVSHSLLQLS